MKDCTCIYYLTWMHVPRLKKICILVLYMNLHVAGSGFYALQSCLNHSCRPNAKAFKRDEVSHSVYVSLCTHQIAGLQSSSNRLDINIPPNGIQYFRDDFSNNSISHFPLCFSHSADLVLYVHGTGFFVVVAFRLQSCDTVCYYLVTSYFM